MIFQSAVNIRYLKIASLMSFECLRNVVFKKCIVGLISGTLLVILLVSLFFFSST